MGKENNNTDISRLNDLVKADEARSAAVQSCQKEVDGIVNELTKHITKNPRAVADFLGEFEDIPIDTLKSDISNYAKDRKSKCSKIQGPT